MHPTCKNRLRYLVSLSAMLGLVPVLSLNVFSAPHAPLPVVQTAERQAPSPPGTRPGPLRVHESGKYLIDEQGHPFFYLGDTAWELFHRLNREQAAAYLDDRAAKGFNVIQAAALAELEGLTVPNAYGHLPLINNDPTQPDTKPGRQNDYWDHVDDIVDMAAERGLYIGMLPTWGDKWAKRHGDGPEIFTPENAEKYGLWLAKRYQNKPIIWILGGDRDPENEVQVETIRAMARGLTSAGGSRHLITYHPQGTSNSAQIFHADPWLDFNMIQSGHVRPVRPNYIDAQKNLARVPTKPTLDGEPCYEDHPVKGENWKNRKEPGTQLAWFDEWDIRKAAYESVLAGACGHTYGNHNIWQFWEPGRAPISDARTPWRDALNHPGARQMSYFKEFFTARPFSHLRAEQSLITKDGAGEENCARAAIADDNSFAVVYLPVGQPVTLNLSPLKAKELKAWWFNPRQNTAQLIGQIPNSASQVFTPPHAGRNNDWLLVVDDAAANLPKIGK